MKSLFTICLLFGVAVASFGQSGGQQPILSIAADLAFPIGGYTDIYSAGFGGSLKCEVPLTPDKIFFTVSAGYERFSYKSSLQSNFGAPSGDSFVPLKAGLKYYPAAGFFLEGQGGIAISTHANMGTAVAYSPGLGYSFINGFEAGLRYESWTKNGSINQLALHVAYRFKQ